MSKNRSTCRIKGCTGVVYSGRLCSTHRQRKQKFGSPYLRPLSGDMRVAETLDAAPLQAEIDRRGGLGEVMDKAGVYGVERESWVRLMSRTRNEYRGRISVDSADKVCCDLLGTHPLFVFGNDWWTGLDAVPVGELVA